MERSRNPGRRLALGTLAVAGIALAGCVAVPVGPYGPPVYADETVPLPPPPPRYEPIGVAPYPGWIWISGHWGWNLNRHVWIGGRWEAPRPGYRWVPPQWHRHGQGWRQAPGYWAR